MRIKEQETRLILQKHDDGDDDDDDDDEVLPLNTASHRYKMQINYIL